MHRGDLCKWRSSLLSIISTSTSNDDGRMSIRVLRAEQWSMRSNARAFSPLFFSHRRPVLPARTKWNITRSDVLHEKAIAANWYSPMCKTRWNTERRVISTPTVKKRTRKRYLSLIQRLLRLWSIAQGWRPSRRRTSETDDNWRWYFKRTGGSGIFRSD